MSGSLLNILKDVLMITVFVMVMMLLIETFTVVSKGKWSRPFRRSIWFQVIFAAMIGILPGCMGGFLIVSLYAQRIVNFAALVTAMIASFGDEAFVMFAMVPEETVILCVFLLLISIFTGIIINIAIGNKSLMKITAPHNDLHFFNHDCSCFKSGKIIPQLRKITFRRALLMGVCILLMLFSFYLNRGQKKWEWESLVFLFSLIIGLIILLTITDHFLTNHVWEHVIKRHTLKIFLWTLGALSLIYFLETQVNIEKWVKGNEWMILLFAVLIGIIPESGPHIIFVTLFANGALPFSILLANSIVQDGHGALPLLAESRKSFFFMKMINLIIGFLAGSIGLYFF